MNTHESDGVEEAVGQNIRAALATAERTGRWLSSAIDRVRRFRDSQSEAAERRAEAQARYQAAWNKAREQLEVVNDPDWWETATPDQIAEVYKAAVTWRDHEKEADRADDVIYQEVLERHGYDLRTPSAEQVRENLEKIQAQREGMAAGGQKRGEHELTYDSSERRERMAEEMRTSGITPELIESRLRADSMNAEPPHDAVQRRRAQTRLRGPRGRPTIRQKLHGHEPLSR